jgi:hypothetical protein
MTRCHEGLAAAGQPGPLLPIGDGDGLENEGRNRYATSVPAAFQAGCPIDEQYLVLAPTFA